MYQKAKIVYAGAADKVILGISMYGGDPDGRDFPFPFEFADDGPGGASLLAGSHSPESQH